MSSHDACYHKIKAQYDVFPSARASQAIAKCRKAHGHAKKSKKGADLKRWGAEKWVNIKTGRPCGNTKDKKEYCRPSKRINSKTPKTRSELSKKRKQQMIRAKNKTGMGKRTKRA
jgi:hypothetical protein